MITMSKRKKINKRIYEESEMRRRQNIDDEWKARCDRVPYEKKGKPKIITEIQHIDYDKNRPRTYTERDLLLKELGFNTYHDYLSSGLWSGIRYKVPSKEVCCCCGEAGHRIHHMDYDFDTLLGLDMTGLFPICDLCHDLIHCEIAGHRTLYQSQRAADKMYWDASHPVISRLGNNRCRRCRKRSDIPIEGTWSCSYCRRSFTIRRISK